MVLDKKGNYKRQDKTFQFKCSDDFFNRLRSASVKAGEPSVSEWVRRIIIKEAAALGVKIPR